MASDTLTNRDGVEQHLFYNVMPPSKGDGSKLVAAAVPVAKPIAQSPAMLGDSKDDTLGGQIAQGKSSSKKMAVIIAILVLLAIAAVGVFWYLQRPKEEPVTLPVAQTETPTPREPETPPETTTPKEWLAQYFGKDTCTEVTVCGDAADPDRDGLANIDEYKVGTDPNNSDSDKDGLADGDEIHLFASSPTQIRTAGDPAYSDLDYARGGYDVKTNDFYTSTRLKEIVEAMQTYGLHSPTTVSLGDKLLEVYGFTDAETSASVKPQGSALPPGFESTPEAKLDRDSQRLASIKKIGIALVKYKQNNPSYPNTPDFANMMEAIKPYLGSATNSKDPINQDPFIYKYIPESNGATFNLTYYSETQGQLIRYKSSSAEQDAAKESAQSSDDQRKTDLETLRSALLLYGATTADASSAEFFIFPTAANYKTELVPDYVSSIPKDPTTGKDYPYTVSAQFDSFTLKATLENPDPGTTGYLCNQEECKDY